MSQRPISSGRPAPERAPAADDEGGLRAPPHLHGWRKAWWWFDFIILVKLARLRFVGVLAAIGIVLTQWDTLTAWYERLTRPATAAEAKSADTEYFCPMHPAIVRDTDKEKCPICFMPLSKRKKGDGHKEALPAGVVNRVQLSPYRVALAGISTWEVRYVPLIKELTAVGFVEFNERQQKTVSARVKGRIDELFVSETGQMVEQDDVLASLYSPELNVTVQNLVDARRSSNAELLRSARTRLKLLGISDDQIEDIVRSGQSNTHLKIRTPIQGHVIKKYIREGQYVEEGTPLYDIVDLSTVWIQAQVYEDDMAFLPTDLLLQHRPLEDDDRLPVTAKTRAFPDEEFHGRLSFVYPHVDQETRTVTVRFELANPGHKLRPGSTATIKLEIPPSEVQSLRNAVSDDEGAAEHLTEGTVLAVPESAVIDTGSQQIVYRQAGPNLFEGVSVRLGPRMADQDGNLLFPVLRGLSEGERIVTAGSFLVDAETRLSPSAGSIYFGGSAGAGSAKSSVTTARPSTPEDPQSQIAAALDKLSPADRRQAEAQQFCPVLPQNRLGVMGTPVKVELQGQTVFLCCEGCLESAEGNPGETLTKVAELREQPASNARSRPAAGHSPKPRATGDDRREKRIQSGLARLSPADRSLAEQQRFCPVLPANRLGSMGAPVKIVMNDEPVFLCCAACEEEARSDSLAVLEKVRQWRKKAR